MIDVREGRIYVGTLPDNVSPNILGKLNTLQTVKLVSLFFNKPLVGRETQKYIYKNSFISYLSYEKRI